MFLSDGMSYLAECRMAEDGESVTYTRGATSLTITAVRGRIKQPANLTNDRTTVNASDMDFLIDPAVLAFATAEPLKGDRITVGSEVYEVMPTVSGEQCWIPCDDYGHLIRVHTRREV